MAIEGLGYTIIRTDKPDEWDVFLRQVVGAMKVADGDRFGDFRIDERPFRYRLVDARGEGDRLVAAAYRMSSRVALDELASRLAGAERPVAWGNADDAASRQVEAFFATSDPSGNGLEFYCGDQVSDVPFRSPAGVGRFVTGVLGMGHAVLGVRDFDEALMFYADVVGFHPTDLPTFHLFGPDGPGTPMAFMHADNGRHHSLAFGQMPPIPSGCIHLMAEMADPRDVEACYRRMADFGVEEAATMGKHSNDGVISFYMKTPAGFDFEIGSGGLVIDPSDWQTTAHHEPSLWGHDWAFIRAIREMQGSAPT